MLTYCAFLLLFVQLSECQDDNIIVSEEDNDELLDDEFLNVTDENSTNLCSNNFSDLDDNLSQVCKFWIQGIALSFIGFCGIIGNAVSYLPFLKTKLQRICGKKCIQIHQKLFQLQFCSKIQLKCV